MCKYTLSVFNNVDQQEASLLIPQCEKAFIGAYRIVEIKNNYINPFSFVIQ